MCLKLGIVFASTENRAGVAPDAICALCGAGWQPAPLRLASRAWVTQGCGNSRSHIMAASQPVDAAPALPAFSRVFVELRPRPAGWRTHRDGAALPCRARARTLR